MRVRLNPPARAQLIAARNYIRAHNPIAARKFRDEVAHRLRQLGSFPDMGHAIPENPDGPLRQILIGPYRFFYRITEGTIWIVSVWHDMQLTSPPSF